MFFAGAAEETLSRAKEACAIELEIPDQASYALACLAEANASLACGDAHAAQRGYDKALNLYGSTGPVFERATALVGLASIQSAAGDHERAMVLLTEAVAVLGADLPIPPDDEAGWFHFTCHEVSRAAGDARSQDYLARAWAATSQRIALVPPEDRERFLTRAPLHRSVHARVHSSA